MPYSMSISETLNLDGSSVSALTAITADNRGGSAPASIPAGKPGTLTTRTDADDGVITLTGGHGLTTGTFDIFWSGGSRANVTGTIVTNAMTITGGSGDDLPVTTTAILVIKPTSVQELTFVDASEVQGIGIKATCPIIVTFYSDPTTVIGTPIRVQADDTNTPKYVYTWHSAKGTNPISADALRVSITHGETSAVSDAQVNVLYN